MGEVSKADWNISSLWSPITVGGLICDTNWVTSHSTPTATDRWHCSWNDVSMASPLTVLSLSLFSSAQKLPPPVSSVPSSPRLQASNLPTLTVIATTAIQALSLSLILIIWFESPRQWISHSTSSSIKNTAISLSQSLSSVSNAKHHKQLKSWWIADWKAYPTTLDMKYTLWVLF